MGEKAVIANAALFFSSVRDSKSFTIYIRHIYTYMYIDVSSRIYMRPCLCCSPLDTLLYKYDLSLPLRVSFSPFLSLSLSLCIYICTRRAGAPVYFPLCLDFIYLRAGLCALYILCLFACGVIIRRGGDFRA